jgi:ABC-2 type transport system permease protein
MRRKIAAIARANRQRVAGDRRIMFVTLVLPVGIMVMVGTIFGTGGKRVPVGVLSTGSGALGAALVAGFHQQPDIFVRTYHHESHLRSDVRRGRVLVGVIVAPGYDAALRAGRQADVRVVAQVGRTDTATARVDISRAVGEQAAVVSAARFAQQEAGMPFDTALAYAHRLARHSTTSFVNPSDHPRSAFSYTAPSNLVLFLFITSLSFGSAFVATRRLGVLRRMLATPTSPATIILGQAVSAVTVALGQVLALLGVGALLFGVKWGDPVAVALLVLVLAAAGAGINLLAGTIARTPEQAIAVGVPVGIALGMLGGTMWPLEGVSPALRMFGHLFPHAWAMDAFIALVFHHASVRVVGPDLAVLALFAVGLGTAATLRLQRVVAHLDA